MQSLYFVINRPFNRIFKEFSPTLDNTNNSILSNCLYYKSVETYIDTFIPFDYRLDSRFEDLRIPAVITIVIYISEIGRYSKTYCLYIFLIRPKGFISLETVNILYR